MKECFVINGGKKLKGEIKVNGAKNAALKAIAASLLFDDQLEIKNVPAVEDVFRLIELLEELGAEIKKNNRALTINPKPIASAKLNDEIAKRIRASVVLTGPFLASRKRIVFPHPGGCIIGRRPINFFLEAWKAMGARIHETQNGYEVKARALKGCEITFRNISVTATETILMAATLAEGKTVLRNAACEPEIPSLADFLNRCGARIKGAGTPTIEIIGSNGKKLRSGKKAYTLIPDRIETGSFLVIGALLGDPLHILNCEPRHLEVPIEVLKSIGIRIETGNDWIKIQRAKKYKNIDIKTREYPGFPTDLQAPFTVLLTQAEGESAVFETVFEGRLNYIEELVRMGGQITAWDSHRAIIRGPSSLRGREIESPDIRAGLAFLIAALIAKGESKINNIYQIDRGYERIEERLRTVGADIQRMSID